MAVPSEGLSVVAVDVELDAVAVVFDFVNPLSPRRSFHLQGRKLGADKARHWMLRLLGRCPGTLCHYATHEKSAVMLGPTAGSLPTLLRIPPTAKPKRRSQALAHTTAIAIPGCIFNVNENDRRTARERGVIERSS